MIISWQVLSLFIPTFLFVSAIPGMCMTLALTLGMSIGLRRTVWMMLGELTGVALVTLCAVAGVAAILLQWPALFWMMKLLGAGYLCWIGVQLWRSTGRLALDVNGQQRHLPRTELAWQGFVTAVANPKAWAFMVALFPPFIEVGKPVVPQLAVLMTLMLVMEAACLTAYAAGGSSLRHLLLKPGNVRMFNRLTGTLMIGVSVWLLAS